MKTSTATATQTYTNTKQRTTHQTPPGCVLCMLLIDRVGRRPLMITCSLASAVVAAVLSGLLLHPHALVNVSWMSVFMLFYLMHTMATIGWWVLVCVHRQWNVGILRGSALSVGHHTPDQLCCVASKLASSPSLLTDSAHALKSHSPSARSLPPLITPAPPPTCTPPTRAALNFIITAEILSVNTRAAGVALHIAIYFSAVRISKHVMARLDCSAWGGAIAFYSVGGGVGAVRVGLVARLVWLGWYLFGLTFWSAHCILGALDIHLPATATPPPPPLHHPPPAIRMAAPPRNRQHPAGLDPLPKGVHSLAVAPVCARGCAATQHGVVGAVQVATSVTATAPCITPCCLSRTPHLPNTHYHYFTSNALLTRAAAGTARAAAGCTKIDVSIQTAPYLPVAFRSCVGSHKPPAAVRQSSHHSPPPHAHTKLTPFLACCTQSSFKAL